MYESPITVYTQLNDVLEEVHKKQEEYVYNYLFEIGVNVDKEELIKALQYDREQYAKGYIDGALDFVKKFEEALANNIDISNAGYHSVMFDANTIIEKMKQKE